MKILTLAAACVIAVSSTGLAEMITVESPHSVNDTIDRLEAAVEKAGAKVFARIDHAAGAASVDMELAPATALIFGNPKLGTPALQAGITMGLDLPLRVLAFEQDGKVWLTYHDPADVAALHGVASDHPVIATMSGALGKLTGAATQ